MLRSHFCSPVIVKARVEILNHGEKCVENRNYVEKCVEILNYGEKCVMYQADDRRKILSHRHLLGDIGTNSDGPERV